ncbi:MAG: hypothetical protein K6E42_07110 [Synergistes sp.]|nr:hypothetical protein [Synergistes sp.]
MKKIITMLSVFAAAALFAASAHAADVFVPKDPVMPLSQIRAGMTGYAKTVFRGTEIVPFEVRVLGTVPSKTSPRNLILIEVLDKNVRENGGIAAGMSGSPVYVDGKLIGAIGYGWSFADNNLGLVTPAEEMSKSMEWNNALPGFDVPKLPEETPKEDKTEEDKPSDAVSGDKPLSADKVLSADKALSDDEVISADEVLSADAVISADNAPAAGDVSADLFFEEDDEAEAGSADEETDTGSAEEKAEASPISERMTLASDGISRRYAARLGRKLGVPVVAMGSEAAGPMPVDLSWKPEPGAAVGAAVAWGDVVVGGIGTLTAVSKDGRFIAFAHPLFNRGGVSYALTQASILKIVPSLQSSFKLGYLGKIAGIVTQDRPEAIGGRLGQLAAAYSYTVNFHDVDEKTNSVRRFQTIADPFIGPDIASAGILGLVDDLWARKGAGTAMMSYTVSGGNMSPSSWTRRNIFYSPKDAVKAMQKEIETLGKLISRNPFREINPYGVTVDVEMTRSPRVVYINKIEVLDEKDKYSPGDTVKVAVTFRPWRKRPVKKTFELKVPENAISFCEITARGGGIEEPDEEPLLTGMRAITTFNEFISELEVQETNNQVIVEISGPEKDTKDKKSKASEKDKEKTSKESALGDASSGKDAARSDKDEKKKDDRKKSKDSLTPADMLEDRFVSEINAERIKNGELIINDTNYYVEGSLRTFIKIKGSSAVDMLRSRLALAALAAGGEDEDPDDVKARAGDEDDEDDEEDDGDETDDDGENEDEDEDEDEESLSFSGLGRGLRKK